MSHEDDLVPKAKAGDSNNRKPDPRKARPERRLQRSVGLPVSMWKILDSISTEHDAPVSRLIEQAIQHYLDALANSGNGNNKG